MKKTKKRRGDLRFVAKFLPGSTGLFVLSAATGIVAIVFEFLIPSVIQFIVDNVLGGKPPEWHESLLRYADALVAAFKENLNLCIPLVVVIGLLSALFTYIRRASAAKGAENLTKTMRDMLFWHIQRLPYKWHTDNKTGDIIQRCTSDVEVIRNFVSGQLLELFRTICMIIISLCFMFPMNTRMTLVALCFMPIIGGFSGIFFHIIKKRFKIADEAEGELSADVQENLTGVCVVRAFGREREEIEKFDEKNERSADLWVRLGIVTGSYWGGGDLLSAMQVMLVIVFGVFEASAGRLTAGMFISFILLNQKLIWPIRGMGRILSELSKASVSVGRVREIMDAQIEPEEPNAQSPDMSGDICFNHVRFSYGSADVPVLHDVNFTIPGGSTFAILGGTGSGKSTLLYLLTRLYDLPQGEEFGSVTISAVDTRSINRAYIRSHIGLVLQEPFLFSRTIRENIASAAPDAHEDAVRYAARIAAVDEAVVAFPQGYDTLVGERGVTLSGGQKQRVAIARMLMQQAPIMIFDDSLSAVDTGTDVKIRAALRRELGEATVVLISHRINSIMHADKIVVLEDGRIVQSGTHAELLSQAGIYRDTWEIQQGR